MGARERVREHLARLVGKEPDTRDLEPLGKRHGVRLPGAPADDDDAKIFEVAKKRSRAHECLDVLSMADVAGVHDHETRIETVFARPTVQARLRCDAVGVDPVLDHAHAIRAGALLLEPATHRLADRDDAVGTPQVSVDHETQKAHQQGVLEALELDRDLGEDVLGDDEERHTEPTGDHKPDVADHRRVGQGEHHIGALERQRAQDAVRQIGGVVDGAKVELCPVERSRPSAEHANAVEDLVGRKI